MLTELDKQAFQEAVATANAGQKLDAYHQLVNLAQKNPDEVDLLLWVAFTAPSGRVANLLIRRAWSLRQQDPTVQMARQWLEKTYPLEVTEVPDSLDLDSLSHATESPPPPPFFAAQTPPPSNNPPPAPPYFEPIPPYSQVPPGYYSPNFVYASPPPFAPGGVYGTYARPNRPLFPYEVLPRGALKDMSSGLVFLIFLAYLFVGFIVFAMLGTPHTYGEVYWVLGFLAAVGATIETSLRRAKYGIGSSSHPVLVFFLTLFFSFFAFALYMADYHRFRYRRDHGWYGPSF